MKRGKAPPIEIKVRLTKAEKLHNAVFRNRGPVAIATLSDAQRRWLDQNCGTCANRNAEMLVTSTLTNEPIKYRHICCHRGPVKIVTQGMSAIELFLPPGKSCSGWAEETSQNLP